MLNDVRYARGDGVIARHVAGEVILVPRDARSVVESSRAAELFVLNETGAYLWEELTTPRTVQELARKLMETFDVSEDAAAGDVQEFLEHLLEIRALVTT